MTNKNYPLAVYQGSGGVKQPQPDDPDNLFGREVVELVLGYGQGVVYGLEDGLKSVFVDGSPLVNSNGDMNIEEFVFSFHQGYEDDTQVKFVLSGESAVDQTSAGQLLPDQVKVLNISGVDVADLSQIDLRFSIPQLYFIHIYDGTYLENYIALEIRYRFPNVDPTKWYYVSNNTSWEWGRRIYNLDGSLKSQVGFGRSQGLKLRVFNFFGYNWGNYPSFNPSASYTWEEIKRMYFIVGKTTAGYNLEIPVPLKFKGEDVEIEIRKLKIAKSLNAQIQYDAEPRNKQAIFYTESNYVGVPDKLYAGLACAQIVAGVTERFQSLPDIILNLKGLIVDVPINYNSETKVYDGDWFGSSFKKAWTDNPVWLLRHLIMSPKLGLRRVRPQLMVNEFEFYEAAKYCDEKIKDTDGQFKLPRYTYNDSVSEIRDASEFLDYMAGSFNAKLLDLGDSFGLRVDGLNLQTQMLFAVESVTLDGFTYSFSALETRYNEIKVTFLNKDIEYNEDRRRVFNQTSIDNYGLMSYEFQAVGCTNYKEALRKAYYLMLTNQTETVSVSFQVPRLGLYLRPFDVIQIADSSMSWGVSGRINTYDPTHIYLRDSLNIPTGEYTIYLQTVAGVIVDTVGFDLNDPYTLNVGNEDLLTIYGDMHSIVFALGSEEIGQPQAFKILNVTEASSESNVYALEAILFNPSKYAKVDNVMVSGGSDGIVVPLVGSSSLAQYNQTPDKPVVTLTSGKYIVNTAGQYELRGLISAIDPKAKKWKVVYSTSGLGADPIVINLTTREFIIPNVDDGEVYAVQIWAYSAGGKESSKRAITHNVDIDETDEMPAPFDFKVVSYDENTRVVSVAWADYNYPTRTGYALKVFKSGVLQESLSVTDPLTMVFDFFFTGDVSLYTVKIQPLENGLESSLTAEDTFNITTSMVFAPESGSVDYDQTTDPKSIKATWLARTETELLDYFISYTVNSGTAVEVYTEDNYVNTALVVGGDYHFEIKSRSVDGVLSTNTLVLDFAAGEVSLSPPEEGSIFVEGEGLKAEWDSNSSAYFEEFVVELYTNGVLSSINTTDNFITFDSEPNTTYLVKVFVKSVFGLISVESLDLAYSLEDVILSAPQSINLSLAFTPTRLKLNLTCSDFSSEFFKAFKVEYFLGGVSQTVVYPETLESYYEITATGLWSVQVSTQSLTGQLSSEVTDSLQVSALYEPLKLYITSDILTGLNLWDYFQANYSGDYAAEFGSVYYVDFIIQSGVMVTAATALEAAIVKDSNWPLGSVPRVIIEEGGIAAGRGGRAGKSAIFVQSADVDSDGLNIWLTLPAENGQAGGACFEVDHAEPLQVVNHGVCAGGGGGQGGHGGFVVHRQLTSFNQIYTYFIHAPSGGGAPYGKKQYRPSDYEFMVEHHGFPEYDTLTTAVDSPHKAFWYWHSNTGDVTQSTSGSPVITNVAGFPSDLISGSFDSTWVSAGFQQGANGQTDGDYNPDTYAQKKTRVGDFYYDNLGAMQYYETVRNNVFNSQDGGRLTGGSGGTPLCFRHDANLYNRLGFLDTDNTEAELLKNRYGLGSGGSLGLKGDDGKDFTEVVKTVTSGIYLKTLAQVEQKYLQAQESGGFGGQAGFVWVGTGGIDLTGNPPIGR